MFSEGFDRFIKKLFPSTFTIAIGLTLITCLLAFWLTEPVDVVKSLNPAYKALADDPLSQSSNHFLQLLGFWYVGMWNTGMLAFAVQMMLILVLGYALASTSGFQKIIHGALAYCTNTAKAAFLITLLTVLVSFFNWGLGLIFGALFARKVAEFALSKNQALNYPLIGAAGYSGLMVWHGGISGSAPLKAAEPGHLLALTEMDLPALSFNQTIFSEMNITICLVLIIILPVFMYWLGRKNPGTLDFNLGKQINFINNNKKHHFSGAEKIDHYKPAGIILGFGFLLLALVKAVKTGNVSFIDPNYLNFVLLGLGLVFGGSIASFLFNVKKAMSAAAGILIQFPLYFGIMGIMKYSGLVEIFSCFLMNISNETTFPIFTFISAGLVNIFVPSGGGQWAIQGPIIIETAQNLGIPLGKAVMALAYGDQVTNMLQPFWALPLLGITGLKAKDIIPYTLFLMMIGIIIFIAGLLIF